MVHLVHQYTPKSIKRHAHSALLVIHLNCSAAAEMLGFSQTYKTKTNMFFVGTGSLRGGLLSASLEAAALQRSACTVHSEGVNFSENTE